MILYIQYMWIEFKWLGSCRESDKEHEKDRVEKRFQLVRAKLQISCEVGKKL